MATIEECIRRNILREYLESKRSEVVDIMMALFDKDLIQEMHDNNIRREGREVGMAEGRIRTTLQLFADGDIGDDVVTKRLGCTKEEIPGLLKQYGIE